MSTTTERLVAEAGLPPGAAADVEPVMSALRDLVPDEAPVPSPALAALLAAPPRFAAPRPRGRLAVVASAAAVLSSVTVTGVAAAANELPEPAQRLVADLSERYLPFHFPQPRHGATPVDPDETPEPGAPTGQDASTVPDDTDDPSGDPTAGPSRDATAGTTEAPSRLPTARPTSASPSPTSGGEPTPSEAPSPGPTGSTQAPPPDAPSAQPGAAEPSGGSRLGADADGAAPSQPTTSPTAEPTAEPTGSLEEGPDERRVDGPTDGPGGTSTG